MKNYPKIIEDVFENQKNLLENDASRNLILEVFDLLENGEIKVAEKFDNNWTINQWVKKAILLSFRFFETKIYDTGVTKWWDKIDNRFAHYTENDFKESAIRIVPGAYVRRGAFIGKNVVLMPSFVNIGANIGDRTMIDTFATVGACAQIGKNCHISGGTGIGGVLEPLQANPVIIEDNCFIGARSEIVEGVIVEEGSVISMGVFLGASTKIFNRQTGEISYGRIPPYSVVVPGSLPSKNSVGEVSLYCAVIVKQVDETTRSKTSINELLRH